jgi:hypothetical protein
MKQESRVRSGVTKAPRYFRSAGGGMRENDKMNSEPTPAAQGRPAQSVSAGWVHLYDQPADVTALPEHFFDFGVSLARVCPETALLYAVLEDAFVCFQKRFEIKNLYAQRAAKAAEKWFFDDDSRELFSFLSICTALGLEPEFIRKKLKLRKRARLDIVPAKI